MERDVNLKLIYIILVLLLALVGTSVFYQIRYNEMKSGYERSFEEINHTLKDLMIKQKDLYSNISEFNVSANREFELAARLEMRMLELEDISRELAFLQQELFECEQNSDLLYVNLSFSNELLAKHEVTVGKLQGKIDRLKTDVENDEHKSVILQDIENIRTELNALKNY
jgi:predicted nuclease with TOPRIM domain